MKPARQALCVGYAMLCCAVVPGYLSGGALCGDRATSEADIGRQAGEQDERETKER